MRLSEEIRWLDRKELSGAWKEFKILAFDVDTSNAKQPDRFLLLAPLQGPQIVSRLSIWGENLNRLIRRLGQETDAWKNCVIRLRMEHDVKSGKDLTVVEGQPSSALSHV